RRIWAAGSDPRTSRSISSPTRITPRSCSSRSHGRCASLPADVSRGRPALPPGVESSAAIMPFDADRSRKGTRLNIIDDIAARRAAWTALRRDIHAHPELGFEEHRTAGIVAQELKRMGLEVHEGLAGTGVVGTWSRGSGLSIGLRADMDALPMSETNTFEHRSRHDGRMHACGHDGHTVMLLAAAEHLSRRTDLEGTIRFIFQPAEEVAGGAKVMLDEGLFQRFPVDAVFGMHNWPGLEVGRFRVRTGAMLASLDTFDIEITGRGAHGALPHQGVDPISVSASVVSALQTIVSRNVDPRQPAVISVTKIHAGDAYNIIPERVVLGGGIRSFDPDVRELLKTRLVELATGVAAALGAEAHVTFGSQYPPVINTPAETALAAEAAEGIVGASAVATDAEPILGSEDFSYMLQRKPGCYLMIGNGTGAGTRMIHNPGYDFNDDVLPLGATYWVRLAEAYLRRSAAGDAMKV